MNLIDKMSNLWNKQRCLRDYSTFYAIRRGILRADTV